MAIFAPVTLLVFNQIFGNNKTWISLIIPVTLSLTFSLLATYGYWSNPGFVYT